MRRRDEKEDKGRMEKRTNLEVGRRIKKERMLEGDISFGREVMDTQKFLERESKILPFSICSHHTQTKEVSVCLTSTHS